MIYLRSFDPAIPYRTRLDVDLPAKWAFTMMSPFKLTACVEAASLRSRDLSIWLNSGLKKNCRFLD